VCVCVKRTCHYVSFYNCREYVESADRAAMASFVAAGVISSLLFAGYFY